MSHTSYTLYHTGAQTRLCGLIHLFPLLSYFQYQYLIFFQKDFHNTHLHSLAGKITKTLTESNNNRTDMNVKNNHLKNHSK